MMMQKPQGEPARSQCRITVEIRLTGGVYVKSEALVVEQTLGNLLLVASRSGPLFPAETLTNSGNAQKVFKLVMPWVNTDILRARQIFTRP
jgi:hypothetical protein